MVTGVRPADLGRIFPRLSSGFKAISAGPIRGRRVSSHGLEIKSGRKGENYFKVLKFKRFKVAYIKKGV